MEELSLQDQVNHWHSIAMQLQSERDTLAQKLDEAERQLTEIVLIGFQTPAAPEISQAHEPFSQ